MRYEKEIRTTATSEMSVTDVWSDEEREVPASFMLRAAVFAMK